MVFGFIINMIVKLSQAFLEGKASLLLVPLVLVGIELLCVIQANFNSRVDRLYRATNGWILSLNSLGLNNANKRQFLFL